MSDTLSPESQTRLSVIMFSDIVGYSKMMQENETLAMKLLGRHNDIIREALKKHDGKEIKVIGDAFLVSFATVANAVRCAVEIQEQFGKYNEGAAEKEKTQVRIGIHMGDIIVKDDDVFGDGVNIASRIEPLAEPGGICISQEVYNLVKHKLDLQVVSLGPKELKNIKDKIEIYEILVGSITSRAHKAKRRRKKQKYGVYVLAGLIVVAIGIFLAIKTLNKPSNPMVTRILKTGSYDVSDPNISPDGNWIVYGITDSRLQHNNLYVVPSSGGEPRKITNDTTIIWKSCPSFSPDASQIVYEREGEKSSENEIHIIPTLGGRSRKIVNRGKLPVWSPDGKHIAFFRSIPNSRPNFTMELFIVNPDGTGETKITQIKPVFSYNVAWSPDSRRLAFLRSFQDSANGQYSEIFVREVNDSTEHQITFEKKTITDFCWTSTGEIVFNSNLGGRLGLWVMSEEGGTPKQLTLGAGTDRVPRISRDAKRLVYLNESNLFNLWTIDLQSKQLQQLTFEEPWVRAVSYSWDGGKLIYFRDNDFDQSQNGIVLCNKDGSEPTKLTPAIDNYTLVMEYGVHWSADMKSVYFSGLQNDTIRKNPDSIIVKYSFFQHELATNATRKIGVGRLLNISRNGKYLLYSPDPNSFRTVLALTSSPDKIIREEHNSEIILGTILTQFSRDSKNVITVDTNGIWFKPLDAGKKELFIKTRERFELVGSMPDDKSLLGGIWNPSSNTTRLVKLYMGSGKIVEITTLPKWSAAFGYYGSVAPDGKTLVFSIYEQKNRIMVLDNFR